MEYPFWIEGQVSADGHPLMLAEPDSVVVEAASLLPPNSRVLDIGAYNGTNGYYLARMGHTSTSVEVNPRYVEDGEKVGRALGSISLRNTFLNRDMRSVAFEREYQAAIATRSLHLVQKHEAYQVLEMMRAAVKNGGLNAIKAYLATPEQQAEMPHRALFEPEELEQLYKSLGWRVINYRENLRPLGSHKNPSGEVRPTVSSYGEIIAQEDSETKRTALRMAQIHRNDPELYTYYMEQAS